MSKNKVAINKFTKTSIWDFKRALEVVLSELGIEISVSGAYAQDFAFMIIFKD